VYSFHWRDTVDITPHLGSQLRLDFFVKVLSIEHNPGLAGLGHVCFVHWLYKFSRIVESILGNGLFKEFRERPTGKLLFGMP
jgi:hypothetical protein